MGRVRKAPTAASLAGRTQGRPSSGRTAWGSTRCSLELLCGVVVLTIVSGSKGQGFKSRCMYVKISLCVCVTL